MYNSTRFSLACSSSLCSTDSTCHNATFNFTARVCVYVCVFALSIVPSQEWETSEYRDVYLGAGECCMLCRACRQCAHVLLPCYGPPQAFLSRLTLGYLMASLCLSPPLPLAPAHLLKLATRFILGFIVRPILHDRLLSYLLLLEDLPAVGSPCLQSHPLSTLLCFDFWEWRAACIALNFHMHWVCPLWCAS